MKLESVMNIVLVICPCLWQGASLMGDENSAGPARLSLSELEKMTLAELEQEQTRLTRLLSDLDPSKQRAESWRSTMNDLAKARVMGEIVRLQYLARVLNAAAAASGPEGPAFEIELPSDPLRMTVVQRHGKDVPGFHGAIKVKIGDITHGQVLLEIVSEEVLRPVVDTISVRVGDVTPFRLGNAEFYLSVVELRNFLIGDDFAVFEISTTRPDETSEIEQLLQTIATSGVVFIRNGNQASGSEAATHLRNKWRNATPRITTVQGFIERIASRSSLTGKPYQVKLADDSVVDAGSWLRERPREVGKQPEP